MRRGGGGFTQLRNAARFVYAGCMADSSFDVVSKIDPMEVENAVNQARKEVEQRYDFKGVGAEIDHKDKAIMIHANTEERANAVLDVLQSKFIKRGLSLKALDSGEPYASGKEYRIESKLKEGIDQATAKKLNKLIRDEGPKSVKSQIQGDELRVSSKSRDDLQETMALLKGADVDTALQFVNVRRAITRTGSPVVIDSGYLRRPGEGSPSIGS